MDQPSDALVELAFVALDHGVESIRDGSGPLIPFALTEDGEGRQLTRFASERIEDGVDQARRHVRESTDTTRAAVVLDGFVTVEGERTDAIVVEAQERGGAGVVFAQRYRPGGRIRKFQTIGNPALIGEASLF